jgi:hypothetical protein
MAAAITGAFEPDTLACDRCDTRHSAEAAIALKNRKKIEPVDPAPPSIRPTN